MCAQANFGTLQLPDCYGRPTCDPPPVCPSCGGLECLCRPRFFAGQLLSEEDLNRLDHYIQAKNRLHNRYLHGWGVACGLEVVCGVCGPDGRVVIKPGYALSPCGNDIVVCKTETVDVCDLIGRCRPPLDDCHDLFAQPAPKPPAGPKNPFVAGAVPEQPTECGGTDDWVLAICYTEKPSRGVAALRASVPDPGCGCGCGGSCGCGDGGGSSAHGQHGQNGACGCGCNGQRTSARRKPHQTPTRALPDQCEPTITCEGYRFVVYKVPPKDADQQQCGAAQWRFLCCAARLFRELEGPQGIVTLEAKHAWVIEFRDAVREFLLDEGVYDCQIAEKLEKIVIPAMSHNPVNAAALMSELNKIALALTDLATIGIQKCACAAMLPPCPDPALNDCVPIATITVARSPCRVLRICNIGARRFLVTMPNIGYWLSWAISGNPLKEYLEKICCTFNPEDWKVAEGADFFGPKAEAAVDAVLPKKKKTKKHKKKAALASLLWNAVTNPRTVTPKLLVLGGLQVADADGKPFVTDDEMAHPVEFLLFNQVLAPMIRRLLPADFNLNSVGATADTTLENLVREIDSLKKTVAEIRRQHP
jgi:hypothetical protein